MRTSCEQSAKCDRVYVSWRWAVGILVPLLITVGSITWAAASTISTLRSAVADLTNKYSAIEQYLRTYNEKLDSYNQKIDTLLSRTSPQH